MKSKYNYFYPAFILCIALVVCALLMSWASYQFATSRGNLFVLAKEDLQSARSSFERDSASFKTEVDNSSLPLNFLKEWQADFIAKPDASAINQQLIDLSDRFRFAVAPPNVTARSDYLFRNERTKALTMQVEASGAFRSLMSFYWMVEESYPALRTEGVSFSAQGTGGATTLKLNLVFPSLLEPPTPKTTP